MKRLGLLLLAACQMPLEPGLRMVPIDPDPLWQVEWNWTWRECGSQVRAVPVVRFDQLRWFQVEGGEATRFPWDGRHPSGVYQPEQRAILLAPYMVTGRTLDASWTRRHDMLHAQTGILDHPDAVFGQCERLAVARGNL